MKIYLNLFDWYLPVGGFCRISQRPLVYSKYILLYFIQAASSTLWPRWKFPSSTPHYSPVPNALKTHWNSTVPAAQMPRVAANVTTSAWQLEHLSCQHVTAN